MERKLFCPKCHTVFISRNNKHCGFEAVDFEPEKHVDYLIGKSNAWINVWSKWKNHWLIRSIAEKHAESGNFSSSAVLNEFISSLVGESVPDPAPEPKGGK